MDKRIIIALVLYIMLVISAEIIISYYAEPSPKYLFSWDDIPGNNTELTKFLGEDVKIGWLQKSEINNWINSSDIKKSGDNKTVTFQKEENLLVFERNKEENKLKLEISGGDTYEYILKNESGKIKIYEPDYLGMRIHVFLKEHGLDSPNWGMGIHVFLILTLLLYSFLYTEKYSLLAYALTFPPLIRLLSTGLPSIKLLSPELSDFNFIYTIVIINALLIVTAYLFIKSSNFTSKDVGFNVGNVKTQLCIGVTGILFGFIEYKILGGYPVISDTLLPTVLLFAFAFLVFTGFSEELVFRGIILTTAEKVFGRNHALILVSFLFTTMHIIWKNPLDLLFVFLVALFYGYAFQRTRSLFGISVSHGLSNVMLFVLIPLITI